MTYFENRVNLFLQQYFEQHFYFLSFSRDKTTGRQHLLSAFFTLLYCIIYFMGLTLNHLIW